MGRWTRALAMAIGVTAASCGGRRARAVQACDGGTGSSGAELDARTGSVLSLRIDGEA